MEHKINNKKLGQGLVEYALIIALVIITSVVALTAISGNLNTNYFSTIIVKLEEAFK